MKTEGPLKPRLEQAISAMFFFPKQVTKSTQITGEDTNSLGIVAKSPCKGYRGRRTEFGFCIISETHGLNSLGERLMRN